MGFILGSPILGNYHSVRAIYMSYSLNSLKGGYIGDNLGNYYRAY